MHLDESEDARPVFVGHPVGRLDLVACLDVGDERLEPLVVRQGLVVELERRRSAVGKIGSRASGSVTGGPIAA